MGDLFTPNQVLGRTQTIGCVAVEITQRCNLDCTLCYLSEHSQSVRDVPIGEMFKRLDAVVDRHSSLLRVIGQYSGAVLNRSGWWLRDRGRVRKLSFFVQSFMDANELEEDRVHACSFMVMTAEGPISMCEHNSRRDEFILKPLDITNEDGSVDHYEPLPVNRPLKATACA